MKKTKTLWNNNKYGIVIFFILSFYLFSKSGKKIDEDILCSYIIGYDTGFGPRKLIASLLSCLFGTITMGKIRFFVFTTSTIICALFSWLCNQFVIKVEKQGEQSRISALFLTIFYLTCPASTMFLLKYPNLGRLDFFLYGFCLLFCILFYHRDKNRLLYYAMTTGLLIAGILMHHIFVATYMSFMVAMFIYDIWGNGFCKKRFLAYSLVGFIAVCSLVAVISLATMNISLDEAIHYNPRIELSRKFVCFGYYAQISDHIEQYVIAKLPRLIAGFLLTLLVLSPLFFAIWRLWSKTKVQLASKYEKCVFSGMMCSFFLFIPAFCITVDYLRWFGAFIFLQILMLAYFAYDEQCKFHISWRIYVSELRSHVFFAAMLLAYCVSLEFFYSDTYCDAVELIMQQLHIHRVETLLPVEYRI